ncbi:MAG: glycoside hydrolase family 3 N-terminal domain-containing protein [Synechococcales bacterium]|nr:glycoside hydrolase family 3 N-terminal domain-containing protein [Synechococcales bacterium]
MNPSLTDSVKPLLAFRSPQSSQSTVVFPSLDSLSLAQQVAQMMIVRTSGYLFDHQLQYPQWEANTQQLQYYIETLGIGGVIFLGGSAAELGLKIQHLQAIAPIPLLTCADVEEGIGQRFTGATWFPPPMALQGVAHRNLDLAVELATAMGMATAKEAQAIGLNWLLTPTVDVNNNPNNPVINVRAFADQPELVSQLTTAFIQGAQRYSVLTCAKHFPGHGDTATDSHLDLPLIPHSLERLQQVEFPPFQSAIAAQVDCVMSGHLNVPVLDPHHITTFSKAVMTDLLRKDWGFAGLTVTDALVMGAIADRYGNAESVVMAVEAGCDLLMMPLEVEEAIAAICQAVETGRIAREQIQQSVQRIWQAKQKVCPAGSPGMLNLHELAQPETWHTVSQILQASLQVRPGNSLPSMTHNLILVDELVGCPYLNRTAPAIVLPRAKGYHLQIIDQNNPNLVSRAVAPNESMTLLQVFIRGNPLRSQQVFQTLVQTQIDQLLAAGTLGAIVIYGSPYVAETLMAQVPSDIPVLFTYGQMPLAQAIALNTLFDRDPQSPLKDRTGMF